MKKIKSLRTRILLFVFSAVMLINLIPIYVSANEFDPLDNLLGEVYIQNVATKKYMDIESDDYGNALTESGAGAVQRNYSGSDSQKWILEWVEASNDHSEGYVIRSAYSGKYLGVSYDDTVLLAQYDTIDDFNIWYINTNTTSDGSYTFTFFPTIPDGYTVALPSPNSGEGARIRQLCEEDMATDECDEWYIVKKVISVVNYYDNSFSAYNNGALIDYIDDAVSFANTVYASNFGIGIYMDGEPIYDSNPIAERCNTYPAGSSCNCYTNHSLHHKGLPAMSDYLIEINRPADHIYVMWANRPPDPNEVYCWINPETNLHETVDAFGAVTNNRPVINVLRVLTDDSVKSLQCMSLTLTHEIVHCLGMNDKTDIYHKYLTYDCLMDVMPSSINSFYSNCLNESSNAFCSQCTQELKVFIGQYITQERQILPTVNKTYLGEQQ